MSTNKPVIPASPVTRLIPLCNEEIRAGNEGKTTFAWGQRETVVAIRDALAAIEMQASHSAAADAVPVAWVSMKDGPPEFKWGDIPFNMLIRVIAALDDGDVRAMEYMAGGWTKEDSKPEWHFPGGRQCLSHHITHWMPLPAHPSLDQRPTAPAATTPAATELTADQKVAMQYGRTDSAVIAEAFVAGLGVGRIEATPATSESVDLRPKLEEAISDKVRAAEDLMQNEPPFRAGQRWNEACEVLTRTLDLVFAAQVAANKPAEVDVLPTFNDGSAFDSHFRDRIDFYADKHRVLLVRQLASRLREAWKGSGKPAAASGEAVNNSFIAAALTGLANHVRAVPQYRLLLGDMEAVDKAIAALTTPPSQAPALPATPQHQVQAGGDAGHRDSQAVDRFAVEMKHKMATSRDKGRGGWDDEAQCTMDQLAAMLVAHVAKGDPVDIANFCMMLHQRERASREHHPCYGGDAVRAIQKAAAPPAPATVLPAKEVAGQIEIVAAKVFEAMALVAGVATKWVPGGNSLMQDEARTFARAIIVALNGGAA